MRFEKPEVSVNLKFVKRIWAVAKRNCDSFFSIRWCHTRAKFPQFGNGTIGNEATWCMLQSFVWQQNLNRCKFRCKRKANTFSRIFFTRTIATIASLQHDGHLWTTTRLTNIFRSISVWAVLIWRCFFRMCLVARWNNFFFWSRICLDPDQRWNRLRRWRFSYRFHRTTLSPILELAMGGDAADESKFTETVQTTVYHAVFGTLQLRKVSNSCSWWRGREVGLTGDKQRSSILCTLGNSTDLGNHIEDVNAVKRCPHNRLNQKLKQESDNERKPFNRTIFQVITSSNTPINPTRKEISGVTTRRRMLPGRCVL